MSKTLKELIEKYWADLPMEMCHKFEELENKNELKETKVYVINCDHDFDFRGAEMLGEYDKIKQKAEELGTVYSLDYFQDEINDECLVLTNSFILID